MHHLGHGGGFLLFIGFLVLVLVLALRGGERS
jgi:hypothetical protein